MSHDETFAPRVLDWFDTHGRKDLPWQRDIDPYRVWVSEIMLQQTQVATVIPYFERYMSALPTVQDLAAAAEDRVLHLWTGLGYYARARNMHRTARQICSELGGEFPATVDGLCELPGIGRSTAGAVVSIAFGQRAVILDGNVKRVLARYHAVDGWPGQGAVHGRLWKIADEHTPAQRSADYAQAMMDLGATVCSRAKPACESCPLCAGCEARALGRQTSFPGKKPRKSLPVKSTTFVMARTVTGDVLLERRPPSGIWGGLWCFPEISTPQDTATWCLDRWGLEPAAIEVWGEFRHTFSHYHLDIRPVELVLGTTPTAIMEAPDQLWYNTGSPPEVGLAAPVTHLLEKMAARR